MQRRTRDCDAAKLHRLEYRNRRQRARAANLHDDVVDFRGSLPRRILVGNGPARRFSRGPKLFLQRGGIHFDDHAVDFVTEVVAFGFHRMAKLDDFIDRFAQRAIFVDPKPRPLHPFKRFPVRGEGFALAGQSVIGKQVQPALRHHGRIELADRAGRGVARVRKARLAQLFALSVNPFENSARQIRLASNFDFAGDLLRLVAQLEWNAANCAHVRRHIFAAESVAARDAAREQAVLVVNRKRQPVNLQLGDVVRRFAASEFAATFVERPQLFNVVAVVERQHRPAMDKFGKTFGRPAADALGRTVRRDQPGMLGFQRAQLLD